MQRVIAYLFELGFLGTTSGFALWAYNDPFRENQESLPKFFYICAASGGTVLAAIYAIRIKRFCQNREEKPSWALEPLYAVTGAAGGALAALGFVKLKAQQIADSIEELKQANLADSERYEEQINTCYQDVFDNRALFTTPDCIVCDISGLGRTAQTFYQAKHKDWFSQIVCRPDSAYWAPAWEGMHNVSMNASLDGDLCGDIYFRDVTNSTEYSLLNYMTNTLRVWPTMEIIVNDLNDSCKELDATGMEIWTFSSNLCLFRRPFEGYCTTEEWIHYSAHYWDDAGEVPEYHYYALPDQVRNLLYTDSFNVQLITVSSVLIFSMLGILGHFLARKVKCGSSPAEPPLEMATLNAEDSETEA